MAYTASECCEASFVGDPLSERNFSLMSHLMTKPTKWHVRPAKTQISLGIRPVWSESSLSAWRKLPIKRTAKTLIRLGGCPGWSEFSLGAHAISLVLSRGGSFNASSFWLWYLLSTWLAFSSDSDDSDLFIIYSFSFSAQIAVTLLFIRSIKLSGWQLFWEVLLSLDPVLQNKICLISSVHFHRIIILQIMQV